MKKIKFTKMHGLGNDFIVIDAMKETKVFSQDQIRFLCDRHFGIGADQLLVVGPSNKADFKMTIFNADGGQVEMCGNGIRCVAAYAYQNQYVKNKKMSVETLAGILQPEILSEGVRVDMGEPILEGKKIPTSFKGEVVQQPLKINDNPLNITCVSMGNPHCVIFEEKLGEYDLHLMGPWVEQDLHFPNRTNVEFVSILSRSEIQCRVWERGTGETLACGTGACASVVASVLNKKTDRKVKVHLKGGTLDVEWDEVSNHVFMTGPASQVFTGEIEI